MSNYASPPGARIPYHRNGSVGFVLDLSGGAHSMPWNGVGSDVIDTPELNDSTLSNHLIPGSWGGTAWVGVILSFKWDVTGYYFGVASGSGGNGQVQTSINTTNGIDGDWVDLEADADMATLYDWSTSGPAATGYRTNIKLATRSGVRAIRFKVHQNGFLGGTATIYTMHVFGVPTAGQTLDVLFPWDPVLDQFLQYNDFGDMARGATAAQSFRVKNFSATKTARGNTITITAPNDATPTLLNQFELSLNGTSGWADSVSIADLAPGAISPVVYIRDAVDPAAAISLWDVEVAAVATGGFS